MNQLSPGKYITGQLINNSGDNWYVGRNWAGKDSDDRYHLALDIHRHNSNGIRISTSKPVYSVAAGTVVKSEENHTGTQYGANGQCMTIRHTSPGGRTYHSFYCHLASRNLNVGDTVIAGQKIGMMGATGNVEKQNGVPVMHLHLSITREQADKGTYGYYLNANGTPVAFDSNANYVDMTYGKSMRFYNPNKYFSQGPSFIDSIG